MTPDTDQDLWRFIRLDQYSRPPDTPRETMRRGLSGLWLHLGWGRKAEESVFAEKKLSQLPQELVEKAAANPDWSAPVAAMTGVLDNWLDAKVPGSATQIFVGPPYHGHAEILTAWAQARGWRLVAAPSPEMILTGGQDWLTQFEEDNAPLVLPHLEHCYLRHYDGLTLLRRLLDHIFSHRRRWLVGCDSWAWAFLSKAFKVDTVFPMPFILGPFDQERLKIWFQQLASESRESSFVFRQADTGKFVLPPAPGDEASGDWNQAAAFENSGFLRNVAAYSLGIPGIAWAVWRLSLGLANQVEKPEGEIDPEALAAGNGDRAYALWVKPWSQLNLPGFPGQRPSPGLLMVSHALLIHGGLWTRVFPELLPLSPLEIMEHLFFLEASGLLQSDQGFWRVSPVGYPPLRQALVSEGYLTDGL
jgi:hypothetical protein